MVKQLISYKYSALINQRKWEGELQLMQCHRQMNMKET